jgi:hypothetical protein
VVRELHGSVPQPAQLGLRRRRGRLTAEFGDGVPADRDGTGVVDRQRGERSEQPVAPRGYGTGRAAGRSQSMRQGRDVETVIEPGRELVGGERVEIRRPCESWVQGFESSGGGQQQRRGLLRAAGDEGQPGPQEVGARLLQPVAAVLMRDVEQILRGGERARGQVGEGGIEPAPPAAGRVRGQLGGAGEEGGGGRDASTVLGAAG